jgi:polysaccharide export outer membrane protein
MDRRWKKGGRMKRLRLSLALFSLIAIFGPGFAISQESGSSKDYVIYPSDVLEISIYGEPELTRSLVVRPDGKISLPLIGDVKVSGHSTQEVKTIVDEKMSAFIPAASSTVIVEQLGSQRYYVLGQVAKPGMFNVAAEVSVLQALSLGGGLTTFADENGIIIIRGYGKDTKKIPFDYGAAKRGKHLEQNILLERGDVVLVP